MWVFGKENKGCVCFSSAPLVWDKVRNAKPLKTAEAWHHGSPLNRAHTQQHLGVGTQLLPKELNVRQRTGSEDED